MTDHDPCRRIHSGGTLTADAVARAFESLDRESLSADAEAALENLRQHLAAMGARNAVLGAALYVQKDVSMKALAQIDDLLKERDVLNARIAALEKAQHWAWEENEHD